MRMPFYSICDVESWSASNQPAGYQAVTMHKTESFNVSSWHAFPKDGSLSEHAPRLPIEACK